MDEGEDQSAAWLVFIMFNKDDKHEHYKIQNNKCGKNLNSSVWCRHTKTEDNHPQDPTQNRLPKYGSQSETMTNCHVLSCCVLFLSFLFTLSPPAGRFRLPFLPLYPPAVPCLLLTTSSPLFPPVPFFPLISPLYLSLFLFLSLSESRLCYSCLNQTIGVFAAT